MLIQFSKMQGLGNDFVVIDAIHQSLHMGPEQMRFLADRHFGIGCDQILLIESPLSEDTDFYYRIFNADGSEVEQCGNGARCFARFVHQKGLSHKTVLDVGTAKGKIKLYIEGDQVRVNMGQPIFEPALIPFKAEQEHLIYSLPVDNDRQIKIGAVSMGNPHVVMISHDPARDIERWGALIENHPYFPERVNAGFMKVLSPECIELKVHERGAGPTLACGTGACAAVVMGRVWGLLAEKVQVYLPGGQLQVIWSGGMEPVWLIGPAEFVFEGQIELKDKK